MFRTARQRGGQAALGAVVLAPLFASPAEAAPITLGSPLTGPFEFAGHCNFVLGCEATATAMSEPGAPRCLVPRLGAERLKVAWKKLIRVDCRLDKVRGRRTRSALGVSRSPQTGTRLAAGAKVGVTLRSPTGSTKGGRR